MIDRTHRLGVGRQAKARSGSAGAASTCRGRPRTPISRSCAGLDELHLDHPFAGSRMHQVMLKAKSYEVGRLHVSTLMKKMGIEALYRRPKTTKPAPGHKVYPYLLRNLAVIRPNQVWAMDTTCVSMARGVGIGLELVATDASLSRGGCRSGFRQTSASRRSRRRWPATAGRTSSTVSLVARLVRATMPNPASQFTSVGFIAVLTGAEVAISMDGKCAWRDNIFVDRLWRTIK
jgi:putative transposase